MNESYEVEPRSAELGGGWRLRLFEVDDHELVEVGGGVFPAGDEGYGDAISEGESWVVSRQGFEA